MPNKGYFQPQLGGGTEGHRAAVVSGEPARKLRVENGHQVQQLVGGKIRGDEADMWLRGNDPAYASRDRDLRRGVKRLPPELRPS